MRGGCWYLPGVAILVAGLAYAAIVPPLTYTADPCNCPDTSNSTAICTCVTGYETSLHPVGPVLVLVAFGALLVVYLRRRRWRPSNPGPPAPRAGPI